MGKGPVVDNLLRALVERSDALQDWFKLTLREHEGRTGRATKEATEGAIEMLLGCSKGAMLAGDWLALWPAFEDDQHRLTADLEAFQAELGSPATPPWEPAELALVVGLTLAQRAGEGFASPDLERQRLAALLLADATEARAYWLACRGLAHCRFPHPALADLEGRIVSVEERQAHRELRSIDGGNYVNRRHDQPGGSRENAAAIRAAWATGEYQTKNQCAAAVCEALGLSLERAAAHLNGQSDPDPWPAKQRKQTR